MCGIERVIESIHSASPPDDDGVKVLAGIVSCVSRPHHFILFLSNNFFFFLRFAPFNEIFTYSLVIHFLFAQYCAFQHKKKLLFSLEARHAYILGARCSVVYTIYVYSRLCWMACARAINDLSNLLTVIPPPRKKTFLTNPAAAAASRPAYTPDNFAQHKGRGGGKRGPQGLRQQTPKTLAILCSL